MLLTIIKFIAAAQVIGLVITALQEWLLPDGE